MNAWSGTIDVLRISRFSSSRMLLKMRFLTVEDPNVYHKQYHIQYIIHTVLVYETCFNI